MARINSQHPMTGNGIGGPPASMLKADSVTKLHASPLVLGGKASQNMPLTQHQQQKPMHPASGTQPNPSLPTAQKKAAVAPSRLMSHKQYLLSKTMRRQPAPASASNTQGQPA